ncbi:hypothetical protein V5O48_002129 [Marasmius crinis-equi]|uniref:Rad4-domain-containing protein n=1 Tax=Marasmius crinis-equi TaxID=585013 RepID=A0ABR3FX40_9AGAR
MDLLPDDSEDDFDWEEVEVPQAQTGQVGLELTLEQAQGLQELENEPEKHLEIILKKAGKDESTKKKGIPHAERILRIGCHKVHTVSLLVSASVRNRWLNDELLHARLLSLTPLPLQNSFAMIHPSRVPEQAMRGRMFEASINRLVEWWRTYFDIIPNGHMRNRTFDGMQQRLIANGYGVGPKKDGEEDVVIDEEAFEDILDDDIEIIRSEKSLMKHALMQTGSRDTSAQLFTALCRGLGIPTRLVVSVQSVPWQAGVGKPKPKYQKKKDNGKGKEKAVETDDVASTAGASSSKPSRVGTPLADGAPAEKSEKAKGKEKAKPQIKLRKTKTKGKVLGSKPKVKRIDPLTTPPVFWTEVFSKPDSRWIPVDSLRGIVNKRHIFDPSTDGPNPENRMVYVMAFEEDGYARDVTRRYAKNYGAKVAKEQGGSSAAGAGGRGRQQWWARVHRDDLEDEELDNAQLIEGMPTTIGGFKDHPLFAQSYCYNTGIPADLYTHRYVLPRHLKQTETIYPPPPETLELGRFRGEPVYSRSSVVSLKTAENWLRSEGRSVKAGEQPIKLVKMRASTVNRQREIELMKEGLPEAGSSGSAVMNGKDGGEVMQGLYARRQTEMFVPDPVVDGKVPKNSFGNIDLYVPSMLPQGAVHIPYKGVAKVARKLGIDHAEAVTGFEFRKRRANPVIEGVVVAAENESVLLEAFWEAEQDAEEKARIKREERVIKLWTRLVHGLRIRQRLQEQYATGSGGGEPSSTPIVNGDEPAGDTEETTREEGVGNSEGGGFLVEAADVVETFHLPRFQHVDEDGQPAQFSITNNHAVNGDSTPEKSRLDHAFETMDVDEGDDVHPPSLTSTLHSSSMPVIKTMQELAEDAAGASGAGGPSNEVEEISLNQVVTPLTPVASSTSGRPSRTSSKRNTPTRGKKTASVTKPRQPTRKSTRKRKRDDAEEEMSSGGEDEEEESPSKRPKAAAAPVTTSTRTLRPRRGKTQAQLLVEEENERAYRRAVAH